MGALAEEHFTLNDCRQKVMHLSRQLDMEKTCGTIFASYFTLRSKSMHSDILHQQQSPGQA